MDIQAKMVNHPYLSAMSYVLSDPNNVRRRLGHVALKKPYLEMRKDFLNACSEMTSATVYKIKRKKKQYAKQHFMANFEPIKYVEHFEKVYSAMDTGKLKSEIWQEYIWQEYGEGWAKLSGLSEVKRYPYSKRKPRPPIPPQWINIQSGQLNKKFKARMDLRGERLLIVVSNDSMHFYFIATTIDNSSRSRMMKRPLLESLYKRFQAIYNEYAEMAGEVFNKEVFLNRQYERKVGRLI